MPKKRHLWVLAAVTLIVTAGCGMGQNAQNAEAPEPAFVAASPTDSGPAFDPITEPPTTEPPTTEPTTVKPKPSVKKSVKPSPTKTQDPNNFEAPACATYQGKAVSKANAKAALNAAAAKHYWPATAPTLTVPSDLVRSIAWNESGWQSNIVNCDGGYGLMQVMPDTVDQMNNRFGLSYDSHVYQQNAQVGANYLAWLTKYIGDNYFAGNYSLSTSKCKSASSWCLLNTVIAAYHAGVGTIESNAKTKKLPATDYVYVVRALMSSCYCDKF
jgi:soluble lytic murein transglycosylase-like protein